MLSAEDIHRKLPPFETRDHTPRIVPKSLIKSFDLIKVKRVASAKVSEGVKVPL